MINLLVYGFYRYFLTCHKRPAAQLLVLKRHIQYITDLIPAIMVEKLYHIMGVKCRGHVHCAGDLVEINCLPLGGFLGAD